MTKRNSDTLEAERPEEAERPQDLDGVDQPAIRLSVPETALVPTQAVPVDGPLRVTAVLQRDRSVKVVPHIL